MFEHDRERLAREMLSKGEDYHQVIRSLVARGMDQKEAGRLVETVSDDLLRAAAPGAAGSSLLLPLIGGLFAAVAGGGLWTLLVEAGRQQLDFLAWVIGLACGFAVRLFARGERGLRLQIVAGACTLAGILFGKYGLFFFSYREDAAGRLGREAAESLSVFSGEVLSAFVENLPQVFSDFDLVWVALALATAWRLTKAAGLAPPVAEPAGQGEEPPFTRR